MSHHRDTRQLIIYDIERRESVSWQTLIWLVAFGLYLLNIGVGLVAQFAHYHFGVAHHVLYFVVFASALLATATMLHPLLCLTLSALAYMPLAKPGTWVHPTVAVFGLSGYLLTVPSIGLFG